ncbi:transcriptional regulator LysR [Gluconobacter thailandicus F149-1 = NBRC 100600]|uniref:LysR family transcriptional regulator n=1 Tax=Gluconobacter thailandicus NBRC 3257 TaxID=1381097 RepID=A0ABQ0J2C0_GLUTH|nr:LysR family transcriptional regulator [Gluconobacter thailandicus]KXV54114.1 LysR family transcriptional regulator [Gluconobacter thailandicus]GAC88759.1 LysR family transcriptional regulator [Gluconobacter thailandicus NBRC 3255]GAD28083.1 LysR family transcriptional regulator [Gluconobacter thailandicus NBRC 3257]GAN94628.1 transcriptional regulator LysR [Gluconobacter thailandicus F149-1 = NBRC 100600]GEL88119.1 LysR family transcriptional regulator [Gluconobacter thailandicus F149-1 = N
MAYDGRLLAGLTVFMAVIEAGSMSRAAETLHMTPSGVGRAIARLETRLGVRLLDRTTRTLRMSDEGRRFCERVGPHLAGIEEAALDVACARQCVSGRLRVNVDPFISRLILARGLADFLADYHALRLELVMRDHVGDLIADGFDMALRFGPPPGGNFTARKMLETRILTVAAPSYLKKHGKLEHPRDLMSHECIDYRDPITGRPFNWEFRRGGEVFPISPPARLMVSDVESMLEACLAGVGIAQVMALGTEKLLQSSRLIDIFTDWPDETFPLFAIYPSRRHRAAKVQAFTDFCLRLFGSV